MLVRIPIQEYELRDIIDNNYAADKRIYKHICNYRDIPVTYGVRLCISTRIVVC